jgi:hypothetical protein
MLFGLFIDDIMNRLEEANTHSLVINKAAGLLFAGNVAIIHSYN